MFLFSPHEYMYTYIINMQGNYVCVNILIYLYVQSNIYIFIYIHVHTLCDYIYTYIHIIYMYICIVHTVHNSSYLSTNSQVLVNPYSSSSNNLVIWYQVHPEDDQLTPGHDNFDFRLIAKVFGIWHEPVRGSHKYQREFGWFGNKR
jgi:hypothetical protein